MWKKVHDDTPVEMAKAILGWKGNSARDSAGGLERQRSCLWNIVGNKSEGNCANGKRDKGTSSKRSETICAVNSGAEGRGEGREITG